MTSDLRVTAANIEVMVEPLERMADGFRQCHATMLRAYVPLAKTVYGQSTVDVLSHEAEEKSPAPRETGDPEASSPDATKKQEGV